MFLSLVLLSCNKQYQKEIKDDFETKLEYNQNDLVNLDSVEFSILNVDRFIEENQKYEYISITLNIINKSKEDFLYDEKLWFIENNEGDEIEISKDLIIDDNLLSGVIKPDESKKVTLLFKYSINERGLTLNYYKNNTELLPSFKFKLIDNLK